MTSHFLTKNGETVQLPCALDHDFEGWPQRVRVRDVNTGAETIVFTNDLRPLVALQGTIVSCKDVWSGEIIERRST